VINKPLGLDNMSHKTHYLIKQVEKGLFCVLDDDDLLLPYHLSSLYKICKKYKLKTDTIFRCTPGRYRFYNMKTEGRKIVEGSNWACNLFDIYDGKVFYSSLDELLDFEYASGQDQKFMGLFSKISVKKNDIKSFPTYIYRWGTGSSHLSGKGKISHEVNSNFISKVNKKSVKEEFIPNWRMPYIEDLENDIFEGNKYGGMGIFRKDWDFIKSFLSSIDCSGVVEFGAGVSTLLFNLAGYEVHSFETMIGTIKKIQEISNVKLSQWDGINQVAIPEEYNVAFIDGPYGGGARGSSYSNVVSSPLIKYVICHDAYREDDESMISKYLSDGWKMIMEDKKKIKIYIRI